METQELRPQPGPQTQFLQSSADITIYGGSAGGGKSFGILLEPLYHIANPRFRCVIFRRNVPQLRLEGGLWDVSQEIYPRAGGNGFNHTLDWKFPTGARIKFAGLDDAQAHFNWQGAQIPLIEFDELTQFSEDQFWFLLSRNRSTSGIKGYIRATCNPDPDSWVRHFIGWWIDPDTGFPIRERSGALRWFVRRGDELHWSSKRQELVRQFGEDSAPKSVTFIPASIQDNRILLTSDPAYLANLKALPLVERERLLNGNWNVRATAGSYFKAEWFQIVESAPRSNHGRVRAWDRAATEKRTGNNPDATVGLLLSKDANGIYYIEDVQKMFASPLTVEKAMRDFARRDGINTIVTFMQDPGSAGVMEAQAAARALDGFNVRYAPATGDKETRAKPVSAQAEAGNVKLVRGLWNTEFLRVLENFPTGRHDDEVDALSLAHEYLREIQNTGAVAIVDTRRETDARWNGIAPCSGRWPRRGILV